MYSRVRYQGSTDDGAAVVDWIMGELESIEASFFDLDMILLVEQHVAPSKPRIGMTVLADGTDWNPGSGEGVYTYYNGAWRKLG